MAINTWPGIIIVVLVTWGSIKSWLQNRSFHALLFKPLGHLGLNITVQTLVPARPVTCKCPKGLGLHQLSECLRILNKMSQDSAQLNVEGGVSFIPSTHVSTSKKLTWQIQSWHTFRDPEYNSAFKMQDKNLFFLNMHSHISVSYNINLLFQKESECVGVFGFLYFPLIGWICHFSLHNSVGILLASKKLENCAEC